MRAIGSFIYTTVLYISVERGGWRDQTTKITTGQRIISHKTNKALPGRQEEVGLLVNYAPNFHYFGIT